MIAVFFTIEKLPVLYIEAPLLELRLNNSSRLLKERENPNIHPFLSLILIPCVHFLHTATSSLAHSSGDSLNQLHSDWLPGVIFSPHRLIAQPHRITSLSRHPLRTAVTSAFVWVTINQKQHIQHSSQNLREHFVSTHLLRRMSERTRAREIGRVRIRETGAMEVGRVGVREGKSEGGGKSGKPLHDLRAYYLLGSCMCSVTPKLVGILGFGVSLETLLHIHDWFYHWPLVSSLTFGSCLLFRRCKLQPSNQALVFIEPSLHPEAP